MDSPLSVCQIKRGQEVFIGWRFGLCLQKALKLFCKQESESKHQSWSGCEGWGVALDWKGHWQVLGTDKAAGNRLIPSVLCKSQDNPGHRFSNLTSLTSVWRDKYTIWPHLVTCWTVILTVKWQRVSWVIQELVYGEVGGEWSQSCGEQVRF